MEILRIWIAVCNATVLCVLSVLFSIISISLCADSNELKNGETPIKRIADNDSPFIPMIKSSYKLDKKQRQASHKGSMAVSDSMATSSDHSDYATYYYDTSHHTDGYALNSENAGHYDNHQIVLAEHQAVDPYFDHYNPHAYHHYPEHYHSYENPHYEHAPQKSSLDKYLILKKLLFPLAGIALLGAAAVFVSNPVLLQLGVLSGKKRRRREISLKDQYNLYYKYK